MAEETEIYGDTLKSLLADCGAMLEGHFQLSSGLHSARYLQLALLLAEPERAADIGRSLSLLQTEAVDLVVSPAIGGLIIGHETARALGVRAFFTERENGLMTMRRGFALKRGERVAVVEDVITTGKSTGEVVSLVRAAGAEVAGVLSIVLRAAKPPEFGTPCRSLLNLPIQSFPPGECPLCLNGTPFVKPGSRPAPSAGAA